MSLINDMLNDLARRDSKLLPFDASPAAYRPLPRGGTLPDAVGFERPRWTAAMTWLGSLLLAALLGWALAWWFQGPDGWPVGKPFWLHTAAPPQKAVATAQREPAPALEGGVTLPSSEMLQPVPSVDQITLSGIVTPPALQRPPVVTVVATAEAVLSTAPRAAAPAPAVPSLNSEKQAGLPHEQSPAPPADPEADRSPRVARQQAPTPPSAGAPEQAAPVTPPAPVLTAPAAVARVEKTPPAPARPAEDQTARQAEQLYGQGAQARKQGKPAEATQSMQAALKLHPQHVGARLELAALLLEQKQSGAAEMLLSEGLMLMPRQSAFTLALAPLWMQAGRQSDAMDLLEQGTRHAAPRDGPYHAYYGTQLLRLKRPQQALQYFELAVASNPAKGEWLLGLGLALQGSGRIQEAIATLRRASASGDLTPQNKAAVDQAIVRLQSQPPPS